MNKFLITGLVCLGIVGTSLQAQEDGRNDFSVSALGSFQKSTDGNGIHQSSSEAAGILFSYRYFFNAHHGLEMDYGYRRYDQQFTSTSAAAPFTGRILVPSYTHDASMSYVFRFTPYHRLRPYVNAGVGALVFAPTSLTSSSVLGSSTLATADFVYGGGVDMSVYKHVNLRLGYRGHFFQAPDLGLTTLYTGSRTHMAEPFAGLSYTF